MQYQVNLWSSDRTMKADIVRAIEASSPDAALSQAMQQQGRTMVNRALIIPADSPRGTMRGWVWRYRCRLLPDGRLVEVL
jgi:hypothetical protein